MDWVKLASTYYNDPSVASLSDAGEVMFVRSLAYCGLAETGGFVPSAVLSTLCRRNGQRRAGAAESLVDGGLWLPSPTGFQVAKWEQHQRDSLDLKRLRDASRMRQQRRRDRLREDDDAPEQEWRTP